ncbi:MAG TPA: cytochrome P450 [Mycobacteriales bacterium]|nr:cytochrome P450 [Mycobacteriales bacterium]
MARLRTTDPVSWVDDLGGWIVTSYDHCRMVLHDPVQFTVDDPRFSTALLVGPSMLSLDGAEHDRHRRPFAASFRPADIRARAANAIEAESTRLVSRFAARGAAELRSELAAPLASATMLSVLGLADLDPTAFSGLYARLVVAISELSPGGMVSEDGRAAWQRLRDILEPAAATQQLSGVDIVEAVSNDAVLLFGGIDTTEGMLTNAVLHILSSPQAQEIGADPVLLAAAVEESLRLEPTAARVDRYATQDLEVGGRRIRRGDLVMVSLTGANRDPAVFAEPDRFDPQRTNAKDHLSFVIGPHFCLGAHLARLETMTALRTLFTLPGLRLDPAHRARAEGLIFRKPTRLPVRWDC